MIHRAAATVNRGCVVLALALLPAPAIAAGGAHVIDDSEVETPGHCHLETWVTRNSPDARLVNLGPACTPRALPWFEIGASIQHIEPGSDTEVAFGPAFKLNLRPADDRLGVAVNVAAAYSTRTRRVETASVIVPLTVTSGAVTINANAGWTWTHSGNRHSGFAGGQVDVAVAPTVALMVEGFDRLPGRGGLQAGVRWTPVDWLDVDLLGGRYADGVAPTALTLGITVRR